MVSRHRWLTTGIGAIALAVLVVASTISLAQEKEKAAASQPAATAPEGMLRFAFGLIKAKDLDGSVSTRTGFTPVNVTTDYSEKQGFGWVGVDGKAATTDWLETRGKLSCKHRPGPNNLLSDWISGGMPFTVDVPKGKYIVTTSLGDWGEYEFYPYGSYTLLYQGKEAFKQVRNRDNIDKWLYVHRYDDYERDLNLFNRYVKPRFDVVTQEVDAADGKITIQAQRDAGPEVYTGTINYVIISPKAQEAAHKKYLADLDALMQFAFNKKFPMGKVPTAYCDGLSPEEKDAGFGVIRNPGEKIYPGTFGSNLNHLKELRAYAALGQFEPVDLAIIPLKSLGGVTCNCSELTGPNGVKITADQIKVGYVKYWDLVDKSATPSTVSPEPYLLIEKNVIPKTEERVTRQFWITLHVPENATGGTYSGTVTVSAEKGGALKFPLTLEVLPMKLDHPGAALLLNYSTPWRELYFGDEKAWWADIEKELILQRDHGMNSVAVECKVPFNSDDVSDWEKFIDIYQKVGMDQPIYFATTMNLYNKFKNLLDPAQQDAYCDVLRKLDAAARKKNQKVIYSLCDETTNASKEAVAALVAKFTHEKIPDILTIGDINGYRELMLCAPNLHAAGFNNGWGGAHGLNRPNHDLINRTVIERVKAAGCEPWFVNGGTGRYPFGAFFWKMESLGVKGKCEWHYYIATSDPYNPFDAEQLNAFGSLVFPDCIPTMILEESRQGINDLRYARTLQRIVAEKANDKDLLTASRIQAAREALDYWTDMLPDRKGTIARTTDGSGGAAGEMTPARLAEFRKEMAYHICRLTNISNPAVCPPEFVLASWEQGEASGLGGTESVAEHATAGSNSGKMVFGKKDAYFDSWGSLRNKDWRGFAALRFDVFNPQDKNIKLVLSIRDQLACCISAESSARKTVVFDLKSGDNKLSVPLAGLLDDGGKRPIDLSCIFNMVLTVQDAADGTTLFIDNMRLAENP